MQASTNGRILVDSGDVIALGLATEMLFVDTGTDVAQAMQDYELANPSPEPVPVAPPEPTAEPVSHVPDLAAQPTTYLDVPQEQEEAKTDEELDEEVHVARLGPEPLCRGGTEYR